MRRIDPQLSSFRIGHVSLRIRRLHDFAECCVFVKQLEDPFHCDQLFLAKGLVPLLPKLRGYCAEFLREVSLARLGIFYPPTCVGLRYGHLSIPASFSRQLVRRFAPPLAVQLGFSAPLPSPTLRPWRLNVGGAGILNPLCIAYAFRPQLSSRLTLGGRAFPRKPWIFGGPDFNRPCRYSCLHTHFWILHIQLPSCSTGSRTLPYHSKLALGIRSFGI